MDLEGELRRVLDLTDAKVPMYLRDGVIEVDDPDGVSPEDAAAQLQGMQEPYVPTGPASPGEPQKGKLQRMAEGFPDTTIGGIVNDVVDGVKFFGDAIRGEAPIRQMNPETGEVEISDQAIKAVTDAGGVAQLGGAPIAMAQRAMGGADDALRSGFGMLDKVARPPKGFITKQVEGETAQQFVERMGREAPIVQTAEEFTARYGQMPSITPEMPSPAVALRSAPPEMRGWTPEIDTSEVAGKPSFASPFAQVGAYFDSLVRMNNGGQPRTWTNPQHQQQILSEAAAEVKHQLMLGDPRSAAFTKVTGFGWYDEDIARTFNTAAKTMPELGMAAKRGVKVPWNGAADNVTPAQARILAAAVGAPQSFGNPASRNADIFLQAYEVFRRTGQFPEKGIFLDDAGAVQSTGKYWTQRAVSEQYIGVLNTLIREIGPGAAADWLITPHTVAELRDLKRRAVNAAGEKIFKGDASMGISGKADEMRPGAFIFGPKGGQFMGNLLGFPGTTTDMWFTRTWNRYLGTSREGLGALAETGLVEQPRNLAERQQMADFSLQLTNMLNGDADLVGRLGRPVTERDAQAVLWYFEQQMYNELGIRVTPTSFGEGAAKYAKRAKEQGGTGIQRRSGDGPDGGNDAPPADAGGQ